MTDPAPRPTSAGGLRHILIATVIAGGIGYTIQFLVPVFAPDSYLVFATAWSAIYLVVTCLSGIQQELTRASHSSANASGFGTWLAFTLIAGVSAIGIVALIFSILNASLFPDHGMVFIGVVSVAAFGYCLVAAVSGAVYGLQDWPAVASMTIADSLIRAVTIAIALLAGGAAITLGWAIAVPFLLAAIGVWIWVGRRVRSRLELDAALGQLLRNSGVTVLASLATGALISGLPLLLKTFASDAGDDLLSSLILGITLTRAPLVVPLLAIQGYLIVTFRDRRGDVTSTVLRWTALVLVVAAAAAAAAAAVGPALMDWLFTEFLSLTALDLALIVLSAGLTGVMCVTGPAVLAAGRHAWYTAGWVTSAVVTVAVLVLPVDAHLRIVLALLTGPLCGAIVHVLAVRKQRSAAGTDDVRR